MSLGFHKAGFLVSLAVDADPINTATYRRNFSDCHVRQWDIRTLTGESIRRLPRIGAEEVTVLFGGPPCQGFSFIGRHQPKDPRNELVYHFFRLVREIRPRYFVMENVQGILAQKFEYLLESSLHQIKNEYDLIRPFQTLDASDFCIPQARKRVFIIGSRKDLSQPSYPTPQVHWPKENWRTGPCCPNVWDAIGDLAPISSSSEIFSSDVFIGELGEPSDYSLDLRSDSPKRRRSRLTGCLHSIHTPETVDRFNRTTPGDYEEKSRLYRLTKLGLAPTLRAGSTKLQGSFTAARPIHPDLPRCITVREAARLHSFPDWFAFHPTRWHGFRQVGNSVPPHLAQAVARQIYQAALGYLDETQVRSASK